MIPQLALYCDWKYSLVITAAYFVLLERAAAIVRKLGLFSGGCSLSGKHRKSNVEIEAY